MNTKMKLLAWAGSAATGCAVGLLLAGILSRPSWTPATSAPPRGETDPASVAARAEPQSPTKLPEGKVGPENEGAGALAAELSALRTEVARLGSEVGELRMAGRRSSRRERETEAVPKAKQGAGTAGDALEHTEALDRAFAAEPQNPEWAAAAGQLVEGMLASDGDLLDRVHHLECRARTCRLELEVDETGEMQKSLMGLLHDLGTEFPSVTVGSLEPGDGSAATVLYLSSDGENRE